MLVKIGGASRHLPNVFKAWEGHSLEIHLRSKYLVELNQSESSFNALIKFFMELDGTNKKIFINWINENYAG